MRQNLSLVTIGVKDLALSRAFYKKLGWIEDSSSQEEVAFFTLHGIILSLYSRKSLAEDAHVSEEGSGFPGITLALNVESPEAVNAVLKEAKNAGAEVTKEGTKTFWGGYNGYFKDPDGALWEVAHNPFWTLDDKGRVFIPDAK